MKCKCCCSVAAAAAVAYLILLRFFSLTLNISPQIRRQHAVVSLSLSSSSSPLLSINYDKLAMRKNNTKNTNESSTLEKRLTKTKVLDLVSASIHDKFNLSYLSKNKRTTTSHIHTAESASERANDRARALAIQYSG